jgi:DNA ligase D-like protein (predicted 3'-phosphoesterase)
VSDPEYRRKRDFSRTPEPKGSQKRKKKKKVEKPEGEDRWPLFVIQQHAARAMHFDFRLEADGALKSWAVPKGPSTDPRDKRLAMPTEDHPLEYVDFEGVIPKGEYGAGPVIIWDRGVYENRSVDKRGRKVSLARAVAQGNIKVTLHGQKVSGGYGLVRTGGPSGERERWLLVKERDAEADARRNPVRTQPKSVVSGRTLKQVLAEEGEGKGD